MSDYEPELLARAEAAGVPVDRRLSAASFEKKIAEAEAESADVPDDDGWPQQVAPQAWLDQEGRRYTDLGEALTGAQECRERS